MDATIQNGIALNPKSILTKVDTTPTADSNNPVSSDGVKTYVDQKDQATNIRVDTLNTQIAASFFFKGSSTFAELPASGNTVNDTYYVTDSDKECWYSWNGTDWIKSSMSQADYAGLIAQLKADVSAEYSTSKTYKVGDYCLYGADGVLYICKIAVTTAGAFDSNKWQAISFGEAVGDIVIADDTQPTSLANKIWLDTDPNPDTVEVITEEDLGNIVAGEFDSASAYAVGDYCIHDAKLYVAKTATAANDGWIAARWQQVTVMGTINDQVGELKTHFEAEQNPITLTGWESGTFDTTNGNNYAQDTFVRNQTKMGLENGTLRITCDNGYKILLFAWDTNGTYIGSLKADGTFTKVTSNYGPVTEFDCTKYPDYLIKVGLRNEPASSSITTGEGTHCRFYCMTDKTLSVENKAADANVVGDKFAEAKSDYDAVVDTTLHISPNLLNFDDTDFVTGKYLSTQYGTLNENASYNTSGFIPVEEGATYTYTNGTPIGTARTINFLCAYDSQKQFIPSASGSSLSNYTVPSGVAYIRFSATSAYFNKANGTCMFYKGTTIDKYYAYYAPYTTHKIKDNAIDEGYINGLIDEKIEYVKNDYGMTIKATSDSMTVGDTLTIASYLDNEKNVVYEFLGYFDSFQSVTLGHGYNIAYGSYVTVDDINVTVYYGDAQQQAQQAHGLNISEFLHIVVSQGQTPYASVEIITATGSYKLNSALWRGCVGTVFAKAGGTVTDVIASVTFKDFNEDVFLFGDSYVTIGDPAKFVYYLDQNGYTHIMIDGYGGRNAQNGLVSFDRTIEMAKPKYAVWNLGMNNSDSENAINFNWKTATDSFIADCESNGITPILCTIPNTPTVLNTYKNAYVKASGKRYVDFAKAVNAETAGATWYTGMLSSDNVHPTELGAKALYARFLTDVPEVIR